MSKLDNRSSSKKSLSEGLRLRNFSLALLLIGLVAAFFADLSIAASEPWSHLLQMLWGLLTPEFNQPTRLLSDLAYTVAFALIGVCCSVLCGFCLSLIFQVRWIRACCALLRAIHELFWALLFIQIFGLSVTTAILAITIPYACTFARVFFDIYQQATVKVEQLFPPNQSRLSGFVYILMPQVWPAMRSYIRYRFECGIRTSAVLGFVGLPTIGFHLEIAFKQAQYSYAAALLLTFYLLIATIKFWLKDWLIPLYLALAWWFLPANDYSPSAQVIWRFFSQDIWPSVINNGDLSGWLIIKTYYQWASEIVSSQAIPAIADTLVLTIMAVALTGLLTFSILPMLASNSWLKRVNQLSLLLMRSTPEYIIAFVLLLLLGPSMLPAVIALAIHNSGLLGFLMAQRIAQHQTPQTAGFSGFYYYIQPMIYPGFVALLLYRAEIILRESAILGVLGITTLGFYIDSAFEDLRFDRALLLLAITALLNVLLDQLARKLQTTLTHQPFLLRSRR